MRAKRFGGSYRDLYVGGDQFKQNAQHYLVRRQREPGDVYSERLIARVLRKLYRLDCRLVYGDAVPQGTGADVRGEQRQRASVLRGVRRTMWTGRARS